MGFFQKLFGVQSEKPPVPDERDITSIEFLEGGVSQAEGYKFIRPSIAGTFLVHMTEATVRVEIPLSGTELTDEELAYCICKALVEEAEMQFSSALQDRVLTLATEAKRGTSSTKADSMCALMSSATATTLAGKANECPNCGAALLESESLCVLCSTGSQPASAASLVADSEHAFATDGTMEVCLPPGWALCSDDDCPCGRPGAMIDRGTGYIFISAEAAEFRRFARTDLKLRQEGPKIADNLARKYPAKPSSLWRRKESFSAILLCLRGAKARNLDLEVAASDAQMAWSAGRVPCRPTPLATGKPNPASAPSPTALSQAVSTEEVIDFVRYACASCHGRLRSKLTLAGKRVKCPKCGHAVEVPRPEDARRVPGTPRTSTASVKPELLALPILPHDLDNWCVQHKERGLSVPAFDAQQITNRQNRLSGAHASKLMETGEWQTRTFSTIWSRALQDQVPIETIECLCRYEFNGPRRTITRLFRYGQDKFATITEVS